MYIYVYIFICIYIHTYVYMIYAYTYIYVSMRLYTYTCTYTHMYIFTHRQKFSKVTAQIHFPHKITTVLTFEKIHLKMLNIFNFSPRTTHQF